MPIPKKKNQPEKINGLKCSSCGGKRIIQNAEIKPNDGGLRPSMSLEIITDKKALLGFGGKKLEYEWVYANLCVDCGKIEWHMPLNSARKLWEEYPDK